MKQSVVLVRPRMLHTRRHICIAFAIDGELAGVWCASRGSHLKRLHGVSCTSIWRRCTMCNQQSRVKAVWCNSDACIQRHEFRNSVMQLFRPNLFFSSFDSLLFFHPAFDRCNSRVSTMVQRWSRLTLVRRPNVMSMFIKTSQPNAICHSSGLLQARLLALVCVRMRVLTVRKKAHYKRLTEWTTTATTATTEVPCSTDQTQYYIFRTTSFLKREKCLYGLCVSVSTRWTRYTESDTIRQHTRGGSLCSTTDIAQNLETVLSPLSLFLPHPSPSPLGSYHSFCFISRMFVKSKTLVIKNMYYICRHAKWVLLVRPFGLASALCVHSIECVVERWMKIDMQDATWLNLFFDAVETELNMLLSLQCMSECVRK